MQFKDYYEVMGVSREATADQVKQAYRKLARKYHPDVSKETDAETRFKELGEAYEVLKDPDKRAAYDKLGSGHRGGEEFSPPPEWGATGRQQPGGLDDDFFETLFGRGFRGNDPPASRDHHARVVIDLEASLAGGSRSFTLGVPEPDANGRIVTRQRTLNVQIPRGIQAGQQIRLAGQGAPAQGKTAAGDLYIEIAFAPHAFYRVEGKDLTVELPVTPWEAALGGSVRTPTPTGAVDLRIPAGSQAGARLRLRGRGLPAKQPGDLYAVLRIALPPASTEEARKAYEAFAAAAPFNPRASMGV